MRSMTTAGGQRKRGVFAPEWRVFFAGLGPGLVTGAADDIWIYDTATGQPSRLTFEGINTSPVWAPDGSRLIVTFDNRLIDLRVCQRLSRPAALNQ